MSVLLTNQQKDFIKQVIEGFITLNINDVVFEENVVKGITDKLEAPTVIFTNHNVEFPFSQFAVLDIKQFYKVVKFDESMTLKVKINDQGIVENVIISDDSRTKIELNARNPKTMRMPRNVKIGEEIAVLDVDAEDIEKVNKMVKLVGSKSINILSTSKEQNQLLLELQSPVNDSVVTYNICSKSDVNKSFFYKYPYIQFVKSIVLGLNTSQQSKTYIDDRGLLVTEFTNSQFQSVTKIVVIPIIE
jgi:flagellar hook protein FlgE